MAGRGRGRGRGAPGGIKGAPWEYDPTLKLDTEPAELYPSHPNIRKGMPTSQRESLQIQYFLKLQEQTHRGPLYTQPRKSVTIAPAKIFSEDQFNRQFSSNRKSEIDPFVGVETYSMKYAPKMNELPKLSDRPFNNELFPRELWSTLDGEDGSSKRRRTATESKRLILGGMEADVGNKAKAMLEKLHSLNDEGDEAEPDEAEDDDEEKDKGEDSADQDEEFEDDELADDYNAEQYFDDGEGDDDGDMGGGGGDDEY